MTKISIIMLKYKVLLAIILVIFIDETIASDGDRSMFFQNCVKYCSKDNCTKSGINFKRSFRHKQTAVDRLLMWTCFDECSYECMWRTTQAFLRRGWHVPQFYGKWPFIRIFGLQEPASVIFSVANFLTHNLMRRKFRREVRRDSPLYWVWQVFSYICLNAWIWSTVFHTRDIPLTELFDYTFAYSMVLASFYCMVIRMIHRTSKILQGVVTVFFILFFWNHFVYLSTGRFDYHYNMKANIVTGITGGFGWLTWCIFQRKKRPYVWKCLLFVILASSALLLEVNDFPPILWIFDAHSIWHLVTVPLTLLFYSFIIDDCQHLRREKFGESDEEKEKLN